MKLPDEGRRNINLKKLRIFTVIMCLCALICSLAVFAACSSAPRLDAPEYVEVDETLLIVKWEPVDGASSYTVDVGGDEKNTHNTRFSIEGISAGTYTVRVRANSESENFSDSNWSAPVTFTREREIGLSYKLINSGTAYEVTSAGSASGDVVIGDMYRGKPIVSIAAQAFRRDNKVTSIVIGNNVKTIGENAFNTCSKLRKVVMSDSVVTLGKYAFQSCRELSEITLSSNLTEIDGYTFSYCSSLKEIVIPDSVTSIGEYAFCNCSSFENIVIGASVQTVGQYAYSKCNAAKSLNTGKCVETIGEYAFESCTALTEVNFGESLKTIEAYAFQNCAVLNNLNIPDNVQKIKKAAFYSCVALEIVKIGSGVTEIGANAFINTAIWSNAATGEIVYADKWIVGSKIDRTTALESLDFRSDTVGICAYAFNGFENLLALSFPDSLKFIGESAFANCPLLSQLQIGNGVEIIGNNAFRGCSRLESAGVRIPESVKNIGTYAFYNTKLWTSVTGGVIYAGNWAVGYIDNGSTVVRIKDGTVGIINYCFYQNETIKSVEIPNSVKEIGRAAFYGCTALVSVTLPYDEESDAGLTAINDYTFYKCSSLSSVELPKTVKSIGRSAFYQCASVAEIILPDGVESIGEYAFYGCSKLSNIELNGGLKSLGSRAFYNCSLIENVVIPQGVKEIGDYTFGKCISLTQVVLNNGLTEIGNYAFYNCYGLVAINLPDSTVKIGNYAFYKCSGLILLTFGEGLERIGDYAFYGCKIINNVVFPSGLHGIGKYAFRGCGELLSVVLSDSIESIEYHAFYDCGKVTFYCESQSMPVKWDGRWNSSYRPVIWGCELSDEGFVVSFTKAYSGSISNWNAKGGISEPYREGYTFVGWTTVEGGTEAEIRVGDAGSVANGTVLYAVWKAEL